MFKRILVPLDRSELAEQALPLAAHLARASGGSLVLLRVVSVFHGAGIYSPVPPHLISNLLEEAHKKEEVYLARIATLPILDGIDVQTVLRYGEPASEILTLAQKELVDLIVMTSHGYTGFKRWALGSVAQKVTRASSIPVLVLRQQGTHPAEALRVLEGPIRALVALDGSPFAEKALIPTLHLVSALSTSLKGEIHLIQLVETPAFEEMGAYGLLEGDNRQEAMSLAGEYLQRLRDQLRRDEARGQAVTISWSTEECLDVAQTLIDRAEHGERRGVDKPFDLIALATHGRGGLRRWLLGSTTERILGHTRLPVLLIHPHMAEQENRLVFSSSSEGHHPEENLFAQD